MTAPTILSGRPRARDGMAAAYASERLQQCGLLGARAHGDGVRGRGQRAEDSIDDSTCERPLIWSPRHAHLVLRYLGSRQATGKRARVHRARGAGASGAGARGQASGMLSARGASTYQRRHVTRRKGNQAICWTQVVLSCAAGRLRHATLSKRERAREHLPGDQETLCRTHILSGTRHAGTEAIMSRAGVVTRYWQASCGACGTPL